MAEQTVAQHRVTDWRERRSFLAIVGATAVVGVLGIVLSVSHTPPFHNDTVAEVAHGLSEALFIAAFVAAVVDPFAKRRFAGEVGRSVLLALFGRNAPQQYIDGLRDALRPDRVTYHVDWQLHLEWHHPGELLRIGLRIESTVQNISDRPMPPTPAWLPPSVADSPGSQFLEYRVRTTPASGPASGMVSRTLSGEELRQAVTTAPAGWLALDLDHALNRLRVPPGAVQDFTLIAVTYQPLSAPMLLVLSNPALHQTMTITGSALRDLRLDSFLGNHAVECTRTDVAGEPQCEYVNDDLVLPGATWRVHWRLADKQSQPKGTDTE
jgi:hypothetical protein